MTQKQAMGMAKKHWGDLAFIKQSRKPVIRFDVGTLVPNSRLAITLGSGPTWEIAFTRAVDKMVEDEDAA